MQLLKSNVAVRQCQTTVLQGSINGIGPLGVVACKRDRQVNCHLTLTGNFPTGQTIHPTPQRRLGQHCYGIAGCPADIGLDLQLLPLGEWYWSQLHDTAPDGHFADIS